RGAQPLELLESSADQTDLRPLDLPLCGTRARRTRSTEARSRARLAELSDALDDDHLRVRRALADRAGLAVDRAVPPLFGLVDAGEFKHNDSLRLPVALERVGLAAADDELTAVGRDADGRELLVLLVEDGIVDVDFNDDVSGHGIEDKWRAR